MIRQALFSSLTSYIVWLFCLAELDRCTVIYKPQGFSCGRAGPFGNEYQNGVCVRCEFHGICRALTVYVTNVQSLNVCLTVLVRFFFFLSELT